ncbi:MAG: glycosyltransferase family 1 protein [Burkholderiales bacterium]|nr:glycosyltransferase family 1 protein [Burkholderiales bacterium]
MNAGSSKELDIVIDELPAPRPSLRLSVVSETYPPEVNGVARTIACVVEGLRSRNHDLQLVRPQQPGDGSADTMPRFHEVLMRGLPIPRYPHLRVGLVSTRRLVSLWSRRRPDLVHIATEGPMGWSALQAATRLRIPVCSDFRTNFHAYSKHYGIGWLHKPIMSYLRKFHNQTACTMVPDDGLRQQLMDYGFRNVVTVARGVDATQFDPRLRSEDLRRAWGVLPQDLVVLHVGRLAAEKNLATLQEAFAAIQRVIPRSRLVVVGDGPSAREVQRACPSAIMAGMRHGAELAAHYASGDLFLFPSVTETYGNVTAEAMASGLPVLAFDYAAASRLIVDGVNGATVHFGDQAAFIARASALACQPEALRGMGRRARQTAEAQRWESVVESLETIYRTVIDAAAHSPAALTSRRPAWLGA